MTRKISLTVITVLAGLALVPAAWANQPNPRGMLASDSVASAQEQAQAQSFDARGAMASDSVDAALASERSRRAAAQFYANSTRGTVLVDRTDPVSAKNSGRDVEWPQVGVGFGLGLLLAIGLFVAMRSTRIRTLAH